MDLGDEIISAKSLGLPEKYRDIFVKLAEAKIISREMEKTFSFLIHARNSIAHEYQTFSKKDVYEAFSKINIIKDFVSIVKRTLQN